MGKGKNIKSSIRLVCCSRKKGYPGWPHIDFDHEGMMDRYLAKLQEALPNCEFTVDYANNAAEAKELFKTNDRFDGVAVFNSSHGVGVANEFLAMKQPGVIIDELYAGSGDLVRLNTRINKEHLPVAVVASSDFQDTINAIRLLHIRKQLQNTKIVLFKNFEPLAQDKVDYIQEALGTGSTWKRYLAGRAGLQEKFDKLKDRFGVEVILKTKKDLQDYFNSIPEEEAQVVADRWSGRAEGIVEPTKKDILDSAKMYLGLKKCLDEEDAEALSVDCIMMFYTTELSVYPCMSHVQMNDDGLTGTCESDLDSCLTQIIIRYMTGQASFVSDPVIDTAANQIIYAHCSAATKWFGEDSMASPYFLRSHSEDHNSTSIQTIMPVGKTVTTAKIDILNNALAIHTAKAVGNVNEEKGCRTKLAAEVPDAQLLLDNWDADIFSWHKVTFYGDHRKEFLDLARLFEMYVVQEDRDIPRYRWDRTGK